MADDLTALSCRVQIPLCYFPLAFDSLVNPLSGDYLDLPPHDVQHAMTNDILTALERTLGTGGVWADRFNATNFTVSAANVVNTVQSIATSATPTFAGLTVSDLTPTYFVLASTLGRLANSVLIQDVTNGLDYTSGNTLYLPIGLTAAQVNAYCAAASDGDTLVLASGTYTWTEALAPTKNVRVKGHGIGRTIVNTSAPNRGVYFNGVSGGFSDLTINLSIASGDAYVVYSVGEVTVNLENILMTAGGASGTRIAIGYDKASGTVRNVVGTIVTADGYTGGLHVAGRSTNTAPNVVNAYDCNFTCSGGASIYTFLYYSQDQGDNAYNTILNLYNCYGTNPASNARGFKASGGVKAFLNVYNSTVSSGLYDALQSDGATLSLYNCTLVNNTTLGTITYSGTVSSSAFKASSLTSGRVPYVSTGGLLIDSASFLFTPGALTVSSDSTHAIIGVRYSGDTTGASFVARKSRGTQGSPAASSANDYAGYLSFQGNGTGLTFSECAGVYSKIQTVGGNTYGNLEFYTRDTGTGNPTNRMDIDQTGAVSIHTETTGGTLDGQQLLLYQNTTENTNKSSGFQFGRYASATFQAIWGDSRSDRDDLYIGGGAGTDVCATSIAFYTGTQGTAVGTERLKIDSAGGIDWSAGNTIYVPLTGSIDTYADAATDGDTLQLAAGTYTITATINPSKKVHIRGAGVGITIVNCATGSMYMFTQVTGVGGMHLSNMTCNHTGATGTVGIATIQVYDITDVVYENMEWNLSGAATACYPFYGGFGSDVTMRNVVINQTGDCNSYGIRIQAESATRNSTWNLYNVRVNVSGHTSGNDALAYVTIGNNASYTTTINLYDCYGYAYESTNDVGIGFSRGGTGCIVNVFGGRFSGNTYDVKNVDTGQALTLSNVVLANNLTNGTITYAGTVVSKNLGLGTAAVGTSGTNTAVIGTGTAPTTSPADTFQMFSQDLLGAAGAATPHVRVETGDIIPVGMNLINDAKGKLINAVYGIVSSVDKIVEFLIFDRTGDVTSLKDFSYIGGTTAHTETLSANASTLSPGIAGMCPYITLSAASDLTTADAADLSFVSGGVDQPFSVICLVNLTDATNSALAMKDVRTTGSEAREWILSFGADDKLSFGLVDGAVNKSRYYNTALTADQGSWNVYGFTYSGTVTTGQKLYRNGVQIDDTTYSDGSYTSMDATTAPVGTYYIHTDGSKQGHFKGKYGVRLIVKEELTLAQMKRLDAVLRAYTGSDLN